MAARRLFLASHTWRDRRALVKAWRACHVGVAAGGRHRHGARRRPSEGSAEGGLHLRALHKERQGGSGLKSPSETAIRACRDPENTLRSLVPLQFYNRFASCCFFFSFYRLDVCSSRKSIYSCGSIFRGDTCGGRCSFTRRPFAPWPTPLGSTADGNAPTPGPETC